MEGGGGAGGEGRGRRRVENERKEQKEIERSKSAHQRSSKNNELNAADVVNTVHSYLAVVLLPLMQFDAQPGVQQPFRCSSRAKSTLP